MTESQGPPNYPAGQPGGYGQQPAGPPPGNNLVWAILSLLCFWPVAIVAIIQAAKVNGLWAQGQQDAARAAAASAKKWAIVAASIWVVAIVIILIVNLANM